MTYRPLGRPTRTAAILWYQQRAEGRASNEFDDNIEILMVDGVRDDHLIQMRIAYPEMQCELHLI